MTDFTGVAQGKHMVDRLPSLVFGEKLAKLLSVPKLENFTSNTWIKFGVCAYLKLS